jgi:hypothetical protein
MAVVRQEVVSLADVRAHLRYPDTDTSDDQVFTSIYIPAATNVIQQECDTVVPTVYDEYYDGGEFSIWTWHKPVLSVENVEEGWGWTNFTLDYVQVNSPNATSMFAYSVDDTEMGQISRRSGGNVNIPFMHGSSNIRVTYTAGRQTVPAAIKLAALELIAHWWQNSQQRSSGGDSMSEYSFGAMDTDFTRSTGATGINAGIPYRVIELLKPYRRLPFIG